MAGVAVNYVSQAFGCTGQNIHKLMTRYVKTHSLHLSTARQASCYDRRTDRFITLTHLCVSAFCRRRSLPDEMLPADDARVHLSLFFIAYTSGTKRFVSRKIYLKWGNTILEDTQCS